MPFYKNKITGPVVRYTGPLHFYDKDQTSNDDLLDHWTRWDSKTGEETPY